MGKLKTPDWITKGFNSKADWEKAQGKKSSNKKSNEKMYKIKMCPKCESTNVRVLLGGKEGKGSKGWECLKCRWNGKNIDEKEINEDEFLEYTEKMEENENE